MTSAAASTTGASVYDLIVIGAGINGAGIARDAAARGLSVLLLDKGDIGSGTSSWSTRLIHGGLRYLEYFEFSLVRESLREREHLLHAAPHLVRPLPLLIPIYRGARHGRLTVWGGMVAYDLLSWDRSLPGHKMLSRSAAMRDEPGLNPRGLRGAAVYYDAQVELAERLVVENALAARRDGAVIRTYAEVTGIITEDGAAKGVRFRDVLKENEGEARAGLVINVAGPWVDRVLAGTPAAGERLIGGTKGSHLVVRGFAGAPTSALYLEAEEDHRPFFIIPWAPGAGLDRAPATSGADGPSSYLIGTTDIAFAGDPGEAAITSQEIEYLLRETNRVIPGASLDRSSILYTYAGVRPLPYEPGARPGAVTRRHNIHEHRDVLPRGGLVSIVGGKLTTYRSLAEDTVDLALKLLGRTFVPCRTGAAVLAEPDSSETLGHSGESLVSDASLARLDRIYGRRTGELLAMIRRDPDLGLPLAAHSTALAAEVVFAFREELARTLVDALARRTMLALGPELGLDVVDEAARVAQRWLGWTEDRAASEVAAYRRYVRRFEVPGPRSALSD